jgi:hypothetical protein
VRFQVIVAAVAAAMASVTAVGGPVLEPNPGGSSRAFVGVGGCAASGCHGGGEQLSKAGSEFTIWATADPHHRAFASLLTPEGQRMARLYRRDPGAEAGRDQLCLKCHAPQGAIDRRFLADGVGCESCHGPAEAWRTTHYLRSWKSLGESERRSLDFIASGNLAERAIACAACHLGRPGMDVDHDLIAAGHPRLTFEFAAYHDMYPKHWNEPAVPGRSAQMWAVGQAVAAATAADLIAHRASGDRGPELADYNCFSCHRTIVNPTSDSSGRLGANEWSFAGLELTVALGSRYSAPQDVRAANLLALMGNPKTPSRELEVEAKRLHTAALKWAATLASLPPPAADVCQSAFLQLSQPTDSRHWDVLAQRFLAVAAIHKSLPPGNRRPEPLARVRDTLAFPQNGSTRWNSPAGFRPEAFNQALSDVRSSALKGG